MKGTKGSSENLVILENMGIIRPNCLRITDAAMKNPDRRKENIKI